MKWIAATLVSLVAVQSQTPTIAQRPEFEVASIKRNTSGATGEQIHMTRGRFAVENMPVRVLIQNAHSLMSFQISGAPGWIDSERYDIVANSGVEASPDAVLHMLRTLLEDRFQLQAHRETRQEPVYLLTVAKDGMKMQPAEGTCIPRDPKNPPPRPRPGEQSPTYCGGMRRSKETLDGLGEPIGETKGFTLSTLSGQLSSILGRAVIDKTGLSGIFNFHLRWTPDPEPVPGGLQQTTSDAAAPSIFTALKEQLGLKLESGRGPVEMLVIDRITRPGAN